MASSAQDRKRPVSSETKGRRSLGTTPAGPARRGGAEMCAADGPFAVKNARRPAETPTRVVTMAGLAG